MRDWDDRETLLRDARTLDDCADVLAKDPPGVYIESRGAKCCVGDVVEELRVTAERLRGEANSPQQTTAPEELAALLQPYAGNFVALERKWVVVGAAPTSEELDTVIGDEAGEYVLGRFSVNEITSRGG